jgi:CheY-like chemotaxis protein
VSAGTSGPAGTILVVDDTDSSRFLFSTWLRRSGYEVVESTSGGEAIAVLKYRDVDLVVLDINLPDISGLEVCTWIKAEIGGGSVPVLHVSATAIAVEDRSAGLVGGADAYLVQPLERAELLATVMALLRLSRSRRRAERMAERLSLLYAATLEFHTSTDAGGLVRALARGAAAISGSDAVVVAVIEGRGFAAWAGAGTSSALLLPCKVADVEATTNGSAEVVARLRSRGLAVPTDFDVVPVRSRSGHALGCLLTAERDEELRPVLSQLALAGAVAAENLRALEVERSIALTLQRSLMPEALHLVPGVTAAARYEASSEPAEVGGDFFEVLPLDSGHIAVAMGDVEGHSLQAATVMAALRNGMRAYLLEGHGPGATLDRLDGLLVRFHPEVTATVVCGVIDVEGARLVLANAGHIPALLTGPGGGGYLEVGGTLLGLPSSHPETVHALAPGWALVLVTDGLLERRDGYFGGALGELRAVVGDGQEDPNLLCERILAEVGPREKRIDDVAVLAVRTSGGDAPGRCQ